MNRYNRWVNRLDGKILNRIDEQILQIGKQIRRLNILIDKQIRWINRLDG